MLNPRIIPCLLVQNKGLVKTVQFSSPKYVGDPLNAVKIFNETTNLPKLQMAPPSTENVDALSTKGKRYAIKSSSSNSTGVFASIEIDQLDPCFEYLLILKWNIKGFSLESCDFA